MPNVDFGLPDRRRPAWAFAASLALHLAILFFPQREAPVERPRPGRLEATLNRRQAARAEETAAAPAAPAPKAEARPRQRRLMTAQGAPTAAPRPWTPAEREEMNRFLEGLATDAKAAPAPTLAQRARAMARDLGRQEGAREAAEGAVLERIPDTPPPEPFSLDLYVDGLIKRLNKSAAYVRDDPRARGVRAAAVQFRVNGDGTLRSFVVLNAGDQQEAIAFIRSVVERAAPYAPFPPDIARGARSLAMTICIRPGGGGGLGFSRLPEGRGC